MNGSDYQELEEQGIDPEDMFDIDRGGIQVDLFTQMGLPELPPFPSLRK